MGMTKVGVVEERGRKGKYDGRRGRKIHIQLHRKKVEGTGRKKSYIERKARKIKYWKAEK